MCTACTVCTVCTVCTLCAMCAVCAVCTVYTVCMLCTVCTVCAVCTVCTVSTVCTVYTVCTACNVCTVYICVTQDSTALPKALGNCISTLESTQKVVTTTIDPVKTTLLFRPLLRPVMHIASPGFSEGLYPTDYWDFIMLVAYLSSL